jgi:hypothetical protein
VSAPRRTGRGVSWSSAIWRSRWSSAAAGLMLKSVGRLMQVDAGFDPRNVLTLQF